jgi:hypothetical protein
VVVPDLVRKAFAELLDGALLAAPAVGTSTRS